MYCQGESCSGRVVSQRQGWDWNSSPRRQMDRQMTDRSRQTQRDKARDTDRHRDNSNQMQASPNSPEV